MRGLGEKPARRLYPHLEELEVEQVQGDVADPRLVARAVKGCETVFHAAAKAGIWGPEDEYQQINVQGTRNVIEASRAMGAVG